MSKSRIPYFDFYPSDFMHGVRGLSAQEVGVYTMLLCRIYEENGPVEFHVMRLSTYCGMRENTFTKVVNKLVDLGKLDLVDGMLSNLLLAKWASWSRKNNSRPAIPTNVKLDVLSEGACTYCGDVNGPFEIDHVFPWSRGGSHDRENLTLACRPCNRSKSDLTVEEWMQ